MAVSLKYTDHQVEDWKQRTSLSIFWRQLSLHNKFVRSFA